MSGQAGYVKFVFKLPLMISQEGKWFYAACPPLDVHSQGLSYEEAKKNLTEAVSLFIQSCFERKVLSDVLLECGFEPAENNNIENGDADMLEMTIPLLACKHVEARAN